MKFLNSFQCYYLSYNGCATDLHKEVNALILWGTLNSPIDL